MTAPAPQPPIQRYDIHEEWSASDGACKDDLCTVTMKERETGDWVKHDDHSHLLATLQAELAEVRGLADQYREERDSQSRVAQGFCQDVANHEHLWNEAKAERDQALAKLAEVERDHDESRAAQRSVISELQQAMCDVFKHLSPPTDRYAPWREQVIAAIDTITAERDQAIAEREAVKGLLKSVIGDAEIYTQPEGDETRGWCSEMNCYLRGGVGIQTIITKEEKARIDAVLGRT